MNQVARKGLATGGFRLRDLVLVVREHEVFSAGVEVEAVTEDFRSHGGALDVPAGAAWTERRFPELLARFRSLPQREVAGGIFFILVDIDASAVFNTVEDLLRELAVFREPRDTEVPAAVLGLVGDVLGGKLLDQRDHLRDTAGGVGDVLRV